MKKNITVTPAQYDDYLRLKAVLLDIEGLRADFFKVVAERNALVEDLGLIKKNYDKLYAVSLEFSEQRDRYADSMVRLSRVLDQVVAEFNASQGVCPR